MILASVLFAAALERPEILAVRCEAVAGGAVVKLLANGMLEPVTTERAGVDFVIAIPATLPEQGLALPQPVPPIRSLAFDGAAPLVRLRVSLQPGTVLEVQTEGSLLTLVFSGPGDAARPGPQDVESLYPLLFPETGEPPDPSTTMSQPATEDEPSDAGVLRFVSVRPAVVLRYVDASATLLDTPTPVRARYLELQPSLLLRINPALSLFGVRVTLAYEPRFRTGEQGIPVLSRPSHFLSAGLEWPVGSTLRVSLGDQYSRGSIETQVVDPGREYFYDVGPFSRNEVSLGIRTDMPGRLDFALGGSVAKETLAPGAAYFGNERRTGLVSARFELTASRTATLTYSLEQVPAPETRPVAEMRASALSLGLEGELTPTLRTDISIGYRSQANPRAPSGGDGFRGMVLAGSLRRELARGAVITLSGGRSTQLSGFESNAFYIVNGAQLAATVPMPAGFQLTGGSSFQANGYRLVAQQLSEPRRDRLWGWTAGLGRTLTRWSYLRADYNRERRRSNVPGLSTATYSFVVQLGVGASGGR